MSYWDINPKNGVGLPLTITVSGYLSDDEGKTWKWKTQLEKVEKGDGSFSYPSMLETPDGLLHITYSYQRKEPLESIKYVVVNPSLIPKSAKNN